jgi:hypothetical protein
MWSDNPWEWPYLRATICGQHVYHTAVSVERPSWPDTRSGGCLSCQTALEERDGRWRRRLVGITTKFCVLFLTIYPYIKRVFFYCFGCADYIAAMGIDQ